ncbi:MAG TPA: nucleoside monophosphate kinase [Patescibacteria group bacterium]|nr:nucleoside monophosphate kinase [Patescibacteria group bacterium]
MNFIVLGPQASGKGAQAELLAKKLGFAHLEMGEVLREIAKQKTSLGEKINQIIYQQGTLVPDSVIKKVANSWLDKVKTSKGIVFDGYPRKLSQYQDLEKILTERGTKINKVIHLKVIEMTSIKRISSRRVCPKCDKEYNLVTRPPKKDKLCDFCQVKLVLRQDDKPKIVKKRLETYHRLTEPLINYVRQQGILIEIDGERPIEVIHQEIMKRLNQ